MSISVVLLSGEKPIVIVLFPNDHFDGTTTKVQNVKPLIFPKLKNSSLITGVRLSGFTIAMTHPSSVAPDDTFRFTPGALTLTVD